MRSRSLRWSEFLTRLTLTSADPVAASIRGDRSLAFSIRTPYRADPLDTVLFAFSSGSKRTPCRINSECAKLDSPRRRSRHSSVLLLARGLVLLSLQGLQVACSSPKQQDRKS